MKKEIQENIKNPLKLETLYRSNKSQFKNDFLELYSELKGDDIADVWYQRLNYISPKNIQNKLDFDLLYTVLASFFGLFLIRLPYILNLSSESDYYMRNIGFIIFIGLIVYFLWKHKQSSSSFIICLATVFISSIYINLLPVNDDSSSIKLAFIHLPLLLWSVLGVSYLGVNTKKLNSRLSFLKYNGDLAVMTAIILISGVILTGLTFTLFNSLNVNIDEFYTQYVITWGAAGAPLFATYFIERNPNLVSKVSPIIAKLFSPLVLITLIVYLVSYFKSGNSLNENRELLIFFNFILVGVLALIVFSITEADNNVKNRWNIIILLILCVVTILVNFTALSALLFRISEWGFTPNRVAVLIGNIIVLINLFLVTYQFVQVYLRKKPIEVVQKVITRYLPVYSIWTIIVVFIFPIIYNFK